MPWSPTFQCDPTRHCGVIGNRFREVSVSLAELIVDAYKVKKFQIIGLPGWGDSGRDLYDVDAKIADGAALTPDEARLMLRTLLAERFQLRIHNETRLLPVYGLVLSKKGFKLIPDQKACGGGRGAGKGSSTRRPSDDPSEALRPWAFYAQALSIFTDRPIVDESGIDGADYCTADGLDPLASIGLEVLPKDGVGFSIYIAVEDKWGVKLEPKKEQVDVLVVDKVDRPSGN